MAILMLWMVLGDLVLAGVPDTLELRDGRVLEGVSAVEVLEDGRVKVIHLGGVSRHDAESLLGFSVQVPGGEGVLVKEEVESDEGLGEGGEIKTAAGKVYKGVRNVRVTPAYVAFIHEGGAASVPWEEMPEAMRTAAGYEAEKAKAFREEENALLEKIDKELLTFSAEQTAAISREDLLKKYRALGIWRPNYIYYDSGKRRALERYANNLLIRGGFTRTEAYRMIEKSKERSPEERARDGERVTKILEAENQSRLRRAPVKIYPGR